MITPTTSSFSDPSPYQVGGSLSPSLSSYVHRQADRQLYQALTAGEFCYVLNSRQMGKSSLLVHTLQRLELAGYRCATLDITSLGSQQVTSTQWYRGVVADLWRGLGLVGQINYKTWWQDQGDGPPVQKLLRFLQEALLERFPQDNFVIFIDEIDSILSLDFSLDDFFALIRFCYNQRAIDPSYRRLTFAIFGVATPTDLIQDHQRTPFNIGRAIALEGFGLEDCAPLLLGLETAINNAPVILQEIVYWTGGQPFLTHKLCALIWQQCCDQGSLLLVPKGSEADWVRQFVGDRILHHWESQDEPEHLRTIQDRLLRHPDRMGRLLGLYQQLLHEGQLPVDQSAETTQLMLSGLVVKTEGCLRVKNPIYQAVFDQRWVTHHLAHLRPYSQTFDAWVASQRQDTSRLLRGQALQDAQTWAEGKRLSDNDYQFLAASVANDHQETERIWAAERSQAIATQLEQSQRNARLQRWLLGITGFGFLLSTSLGVVAALESRRASTSEQLARRSEVTALTASAQGWFDSKKRLDALLQAIRAQQQLNQLHTPAPELAQTVDAVLHKILFGINEVNRFSGHTGDINDVAYSPRGDLIASASADGTIKLWQPDGQLRHTLESDPRGVSHVRFSPDGEVLAAGGTSGTIALWHPQTGESLATLTMKDRITSLAFSPDGHWLAAGSIDGTIQLWQIDGASSQAIGTPRLTLRHTLTGHRAMVRSLAFSPDGQTLASASADTTLKLWSLTTGQLTRTLEGHTATVTEVVFSLDGETLASSSSDKTLKIWSSAGDLRQTFIGHRAPVTSLRFSPQGDRLVSTSEDHELRFWRLSGEPILAYADLAGAGKAIDFSPDGRYLVSSGPMESREVMLWQLESPFYRVIGEHDAGVIALAISPDGQTLASAGSDRTLKLWQPHQDSTSEENGTLLKSIPNAHRAPIIHLAFSPDGQVLSSSSFDNTVRLWQQNGTPLLTYRDPNNIAGQVAFNPHNSMVASGGAAGTVNLWQRDGQMIRTLTVETQGLINRLAWNPAGTQLALGGTDSAIHLINAETWAVEQTLAEHTGSIYDLAYSADGLLLASASDDHTVKLWNAQTGQLIRTLVGHSDAVWTVAFAPATAPQPIALASAGADKTIKLWDAEGKLITTLSRHRALVHGLAFSPDGQSLFSAGRDNIILQWNLAAIAQLQPLESACALIKDYLTTNTTLSPEDRQLCDQL